MLYEHSDYGGPMPKNLKILEIQRTRLLQELQTLGDFRPGTISVNYRKCGIPLLTYQLPPFV